MFTLPKPFLLTRLLWLFWPWCSKSLQLRRPDQKACRISCRRLTRTGDMVHQKWIYIEIAWIESGASFENDKNELPSFEMTGTLDHQLSRQLAETRWTFGPKWRWNSYAKEPEYASLWKQWGEQCLGHFRTLPYTVYRIHCFTTHISHANPCPNAFLLAHSRECSGIFQLQCIL